MTDENEEQNISKEKLGGIGQEIIGELELIGGILTADPIAQAEGEFNVEAGTIRRESGEALEETEDANESEESE
jgi:hypothetical protein